MLFGNTKTSSLVILCDLRYLTGNISSVMTKHLGVQCKLHRFAYLIVQIILCFWSYLSHAIPSLYFGSLSPAPEINTGNFTPAETTSEAYNIRWVSKDTSGHLSPLSSLPSWWRHQMEIFSALLAICAENSPVPGEFPAQRPVVRSFNVFFDLRLNKQLSKYSWGWWFETLPRPLWHHSNKSQDWSKILTRVKPWI